MSSFDPDDPADCDQLYGLPHGQDDARILVLPVPWQGTASFGMGTAHGPQAVCMASKQVDLHHPLYGDRIWQAGLSMEPTDGRFEAEWTSSDRERSPARINPISEAIDAMVESWVRACLHKEQIPALLGGEHRIAFGGIRAALAQQPDLGVLHIDAHGDLRCAYEGFTRSHASVFYNLLQEAPETFRLVQVGLRDLGSKERDLIKSDARIRSFFDLELARAWAIGRAWTEQVEQILAALPKHVWISFDVDGLEPQLCPGTGTPVPGGLSWNQATLLLQALGASGRRIIGFDLCEVGAGAWDGNVGARLLYELAGATLTSHD